LNPKELDWFKDRDKNWFYGPFYPNENYYSHVCPSNSLQSLSIPSPGSNLKPAIKRKLHPKDYIILIKSNSLLRRTFSDSALADNRFERPKVKDIQQSPSTPKDTVIQFFEEEIRLLSPPTNVGKRVRVNSYVEERVFDSSSDTPTTPVKPIDMPHNGMDVEIVSNLTTVTSKNLLDLQSGNIGSKIFKVEILAQATFDIIPAVNKSTREIPEECKTNFRLPNEKVSKYLANWEKDVNYHTDTEYLDYPPEDISDDYTEDIVLPSFGSYGLTEYISDTIVNTINVSSFLWKTAKTTFW
jgi:hypothetical protein